MATTTTWTDDPANDPLLYALEMVRIRGREEAWQVAMETHGRTLVDLRTELTNLRAESSALYTATANCDLAGAGVSASMLRERISLVLGMLDHVGL